MSGFDPIDQISVPVPGSEETRRLERQSMHNWFLLATICAMSVVGLLIAVLPVLSDSISSFWPWARTDLALFIGLGGSILLLILYLTTQQMKVTGMRYKVQTIEADAKLQERQHASRLHALLNVSRMMGAVTDPSSVFEGITNVCLEIFDCHQASFMLLNPHTGLLEMKAATGHSNVDELDGVTQKVGEGIAGWVAENKVPVVLGKDLDPERYPGLRPRKTDLSAAMVTPILVRDELVGILNISSRAAGATYTADDLSALRVFAENAGTCIRQAERAEWMRQTIEQQQRQLAAREQHDQPI